MLFVNFRAAGGQLMLDRQTICRKSSQIGGRQDEMCRNEPEIIDEVLTGVQLAMEECQIQFQDRRWNCTSDKASMSNLLRKNMGKEYYQLCPFIAWYLEMYWIDLTPFITIELKTVHSCRNSSIGLYVRILVLVC